MAFSLRRAVIRHVDAALSERLEDTFASRERERAIRKRSDEAWYFTGRSIAREILDRLARPVGHRFDQVGFWRLSPNGCMRMPSRVTPHELRFQDGADR
jgi:DivIVA domain-containing protein